MASNAARALLRPRPRPAALHRTGRRLLSEWTRQRETLSHLRDAHADREIYLVGTAHVSQRSADEVSELIRLVRPDHVAVELCPARAARLRAGDGEQDFAAALQRAFGAGAGGTGLLGAAFQALNGLWKQYGLVPGVDFKAALEAADRAGVRAHCIDRDVNETLRLLYQALGETDLARVLSTPPPREMMMGMMSGGGLGEAVENLKDRAQVAALRRHMNGAAPAIVEVMLHQRDRLMVKELRRKCPSGVVVAVVGLAHMDGIEREWLVQDDLRRVSS